MLSAIVRRIGGVALAATVLSSGVRPAFAEAAKPERIGACVATRIARIGFRLGTPGSGSVLLLANGIPQVSYDPVAAIERSRVGDPVTTCLVTLPEDCPPGDSRGRRYRTVNRRTGASWLLPDSEHACGGA